MEDETILDLYFAREERAIAETGKKYGGYCRSIAFNILRSHPVHADPRRSRRGFAHQLRRSERLSLLGQE
ncbi:MAG: hypothetical protein PUF20_02295 [Clostridiales bacterium]|nr:hypothetical protein [Clostridiales bacterium]